MRRLIGGSLGSQSRAAAPAPRRTGLGSRLAARGAATVWLSLFIGGEGRMKSLLTTPAPCSELCFAPGD